MKRFLRELSVWWFATMVPEYAVLTTIMERETLRKRRLLSGMLLISSVLTLIDIPLSMVIHASGQQVYLLCLFSLISFLALEINRRGFLIRAGLFYFIVVAFLEMLFVILGAYQVPIFAVCLWPILLVSLITIGFFLPAWGPLLLSVMLMLFYCWLMLVGCQQQIASSIADPYVRTFVLV